MPFPDEVVLVLEVLTRVQALEAEEEQGKGSDPLRHSHSAIIMPSLETKPRTVLNHVNFSLSSNRETVNPAEGQRTE